MSQNDEKLIKSISILDDKINIILKEKDNSFINNKSIINKANYPPSMLLFFDDTSMYYDEAHNEKNYYDLKIDTKISLFIELESVIIIRNRNVYGKTEYSLYGNNETISRYSMLIYYYCIE